MLRAGIIGAGFIAQVHAAAYAAQPHVELAVIADPHVHKAQALADRYGARAVAQVDELLASDVDVVSVCTPTPTHADVSIAAMRAGKHVLCEKPMARSLVQAEAMIAAARDTGTKLMVGHVTRYEPDHVRAKELIDRGDIGTLRMAFQGITGPFPEWSSGGWFADAAQSGGPVVDLAIHTFDSLAWFFGRPVTRVMAVGTKSKIDLYSYALVTLNFDGGGLGLVEVSWSHPRAQDLTVRTELVGTHGRINWDYADMASMFTIGNDTPRRQFVMLGEQSFGQEVAAFVDCVERDVPPPISGEQALETLRIALAAHESLETGRAVVLGERYHGQRS